jgi:hypothetical protein
MCIGLAGMTTVVPSSSVTVSGYETGDGLGDGTADGLAVGAAVADGAADADGVAVAEGAAEGDGEGATEAVAGGAEALAGAADDGAALVAVGMDAGTNVGVAAEQPASISAKTMARTLAGPMRRLPIRARSGPSLRREGGAGKKNRMGDAYPFLSRVRATPRGRRPDFRRVPSVKRGGHRSGTVPELHRLRDQAAGDMGCRAGA